MTDKDQNISLITESASNHNQLETMEVKELLDGTESKPNAFSWSNFLAAPLLNNLKDYFSRPKTSNQSLFDDLTPSIEFLQHPLYLANRSPVATGHCNAYRFFATCRQLGSANTIRCVQVEYSTEQLKTFLPDFSIP